MLASPNTMAFAKESLSYSAKQKAMAIVPKCGAFLSIIGSGYILQYIIRRPEKRRTVFSRLILGLSTSDLVLSTCFFLSTWPAPVGTPGAYGAAGTTQTCTAQGFFSQGAALCTPIYNGALALYYLLVIRFQWREDQLRKIEPLLHGVPIAFGLGTAVTGLVLDLYNYANWICWIAPLPWGCKDSARYGTSDCERGDNAWVFQWAFLYGPVWFLIAFVALAMLLVYRTVLQAERKTKRWTQQGSMNAKKRQSHSKKVANQGMLYVTVFLLTWLFATLTRILDLIKNRTYFPIVILMAFFLPCQGFFNALVYLRPRYLRYREQKNPDQNPVKYVIRSLSSNLRRSNTGVSPTVQEFEDNDLCTLPPALDDKVREDGSEQGVKKQESFFDEEDVEAVS